MHAEVADGEYLDEGNVSGQTSSDIGRFYANQVSLQTASIDPGCETGSFSYMSDLSGSYLPMDARYTLQAQTALGSVATNYDQGLGYPVQNVITVAENSNDGVNRIDRVFATPTAWIEGQYAPSDDDNLGFTRLEAGGSEVVDGPFDELQFGLQLQGASDPTQFDSAVLNMNPDTASDCEDDANCNTAALGSEMNLRFGRLVTENRHGPETADLSVPFQIEFWNGDAFVVNTNDSCTRLMATDVTFNGLPLSNISNRSVDFAVGGGADTTGTFIDATASDIGFANGDAGLSFSAPGAGTTGRFPIGINLINTPWFRFDWNQNGNNADDQTVPDAQISFGNYRGHDRIIYWQEVFDN